MKFKLFVSVGVMVIITILVIAFRNKTTYKYYDVSGNSGTSSKCEVKTESLVCKTKDGWIRVNQFSEE